MLPSSHSNYKATPLMGVESLSFFLRKTVHVRVGSVDQCVPANRRRSGDSFTEAILAEKFELSPRFYNESRAVVVAEIHTSVARHWGRVAGATQSLTIDLL